jgi:hypothetical protein
MSSARSIAGRRRLLALLTVAVLVSVLTGYPAGAVFTASTTSGSSFAAAATFLSYPASVSGNSPWAYHRDDESPSSAATSAAADNAGVRPGIYNGITNGPSTYWNFDEGSGTRANDASGAANAGTVGSGATWIKTGRTNGALSLDGTTNAYVSGMVPAVNTSTSFTVSAWVYLSGASLPTVNMSVMSAPGTNSRAFSMKYDSGKKWSWTLARTDTNNPSYDLTYSTADAALNTWTHLVGVYDSAAPAGQQIKLYVNAGTPVVAGRTSVWTSTEGFQVGRSFFNGAYVDNFNGRIDEVRSFRRALTAAEITALYGDSPTLAYDFEENAGTTVNDNSGNGDTGTLGGAGTTWTSSGNTGNSVSMDGTTTGYVTSSTSPVNTNASFTISAWVYLTGAALPASKKAILSQEGGTGPAFTLTYSSATKWAFFMTGNDAANPTLDWLDSTIAPTLNTWTHLVGVYDSAATAAQRLKFYVNASTPIMRAHSTVWNATGPLSVGRAFWNNGYTDNWTGMIDDVRTYQRALTAAEITQLYSPTATAQMTAGVPGALQGAQQGQQASNAVAFNGTTNAYNNTQITTAPGDFTIECWFKSTSTTGGQLIAYTLEKTGNPNTGRDRMLFLDSANRLTFGIWWNNSARTLRSSLTYNDGAWHHVAASYGAAGLKLYVDGTLLASNAAYNPTANPAGTFAGYWRWGGGRVGWPNSPASDYLTGSLDEVAIWHSQLSDQQIAWHYYANH